jgi:CNT family concentrative nucleoside transporter
MLTMMTGGMAHVSGAVMLAYVAMGAPLKYLITASVMAAPGTFLISKLLWPEAETPVTMGEIRVKVEKTSTNFIEAAAGGASQGMTLVLNISAMLIAFIALIAMLNGFLGWVGSFWGNPHFALQTIFGWVMSPLAVILGAPRQDAPIIGNLIANKTVINEFFAFSMMKDVVANFTEKGKIIATFALCGFANFSSIGIQIGGIGGLAPTRKTNLAQLGLRALLAGSMVSFMTAALAGLLYRP